MTNALSLAEKVRYLEDIKDSPGWQVLSEWFYDQHAIAVGMILEANATDIDYKRGVAKTYRAAANAANYLIHETNSRIMEMQQFEFDNLEGADEDA